MVINVTHVTACVDSSPLSAKVIQHAKAIVEIFGGALSLIHVIEPEKLPHAPSDPVEWDMRRLEAETFISGLARGFNSKSGTVETKILEGHSADRICGVLPDDEEGITVLCRSKDEQRVKFGDTTRRVMEISTGSILLVPASVPTLNRVKYKRVLVPLDGSSRAESAVPYAVRIARAHNAELILAHATAEPDLMHGDPPNVEYNELRDRLIRRNERAAREYLVKILHQLHDCGANVRTLVLKGEDARRLLVRAIGEQMTDIVVLTAYGKSGFADVPFGSVTSFVMAQSSVPVLMVRHVEKSGIDHLISLTGSNGVRLPVGHVK